MSKQPTPIEVIHNALTDSLKDEYGAIDVFVPEQCMLVCIGDKVFHITVEPYNC